MSKASKGFRKRAANHLRQSRKEPEGPVQQREKALAAGYKEYNVFKQRKVAERAKL